MKSPGNVVVFALDSQRYALSLSQVERVVRTVEITPLPQAPDIVSGVINLQGRIVPVFNIRKRFRLTEREIGLSDQMIVANTSRRTISFWVEAVEGVMELPDHKIVPPEEILPEMDYVEGVVKLDNGMVFIHDLERFLSLEEESALDNALKGKDGEEGR